ncbi:hypothetical protein B0J11DRAFT_600954 [Dendryphion nanum]|uniref:Pre-mRNA-processing factor 39 n=1 Tax=Dendryphion nanum TaxID=256645 RepID=A0A9P9IT60_9PLEO|nr:hypothetical protein B0J11DRAFT_600954 [Dendryphion nanum]
MLYVRGGIAAVHYTGDEAVEEINQLLQNVIDNEDEFQPWEILVGRVAELEGGLHRNSSPDAIELLRKVYDAFLSKFPLFFGYWKKYADYEFAIGGTEAAEMVYERGVACNPTSVDLWVHFCQFRMNTCHDNVIVRELFKRAADFVCLDYQSHPFWDKYIEFEERLGETGNLTAIYKRAALEVSWTHQSYYDKLRVAIGSRPLEELVEQDVLASIQSAIRLEHPELAELDFDRCVRHKIDEHFYPAFGAAQRGAASCYEYEKNIKRAYFHVAKLDEAELQNWRDYLSFQERQGDYRRTAFLYERCLVTCALYEEFWLRYARWMFSQNNGTTFSGQKDDNTRLIYMRASCIFVSLDEPTVRLHWARLEEKLKRPDIAEGIHEAILDVNPGNIKTIISMAGLKRRTGQNSDAIQYLEQQINAHTADISGQLVAEQARIRWQCDNDIQGARDTFQRSASRLSDSQPLWKSWLQFEMNQAAATGRDQVKNVHNMMHAQSALSPAQKKELSQDYLAYLLECGGIDAARDYMLLDRDINGSGATTKTEDQTKVEVDEGVDSQSGPANGHQESVEYPSIKCQDP